MKRRMALERLFSSADSTRVSSISAISLLSDVLRLFASLFSAFQKASSSVMLVGCPWIVTERFFI